MTEAKVPVMVSPMLKPMTAGEYYSRPESMLPEQLLDGELVVSPAPTFEHQVAVRNVFNLLQSLIPGGGVYFAPVDIRLDAQTVVQPDVFWLSGSSRCQLINERLQGPPELIVEVLSPATARYDRSTKFSIYERFGVPEYWIVDLDVHAIEVWTMRDGLLQRAGNFLAGAAFESLALSGKLVETALIFP